MQRPCLGLGDEPPEPSDALIEALKGARCADGGGICLPRELDAMLLMRFIRRQIEHSRNAWYQCGPGDPAHDAGPAPAIPKGPVT